MDKVKVLIVDDSAYLRKFDTLDVEMRGYEWKRSIKSDYG